MIDLFTQNQILNYFLKYDYFKKNISKFIMEEPNLWIDTLKSIIS